MKNSQTDEVDSNYSCRCQLLNKYTQEYCKGSCRSGQTNKNIKKIYLKLQQKKSSFLQNVTDKKKDQRLSEHLSYGKERVSRR